MAITKDTGRQWPLYASVDFAFGDIPTTATFYEAIDLPGSARVIGGYIEVTAVWDSTTNSVNVGDSGSATRYATGVDLKALGVTELSAGGAVGALDVGVTYTETGTAATTGAATLVVGYVLDGRANEVQPTAD